MTFMIDRSQKLTWNQTSLSTVKSQNLTFFSELKFRRSSENLPKKQVSMETELLINGQKCMFLVNTGSSINGYLL